MAIYENSPPLNKDIANFIVATGIKNNTQIKAVSYLGNNLISTGLYDKMLAIYPIIGGTSGSHMYNLKNAVDSDAAYRLTYAGGWTHDSTGMIPASNGSTYAVTYIAPNNSFLGQNSISLWYYSGVAAGGANQHLIGANTSNFSNGARLSVSDSYEQLNGSEANYTPSATTTGLLGVSRIVSTEYIKYIRGSVFRTNTNNNSAAPVSFNFYLGSINSAGASSRATTSCTCRFAAIGLGLTSTEATTLNNIVQQYETLLGRNAY